VATDGDPPQLGPRLFGPSPWGSDVLARQALGRAAQGPTIREKVILALHRAAEAREDYARNCKENPEQFFTSPNTVMAKLGMSATDQVCHLGQAYDPDVLADKIRQRWVTTDEVNFRWKSKNDLLGDTQDDQDDREELKEAIEGHIRARFPWM
jgi:hypothetical protein